ncbi:MAG: oligosaccharide flippase family protein, partial [Candidatus Aenigmatarchaeota archaeon]
MSFKRKVLSNVVYNFGSIIVISLAGYIYWIIGGKFLLPGQYGVVSLIIAVFGFLLPIATWGLGIAVRRFIPISQSKGRTHDIRDIILFSLKITIILSLILGAGAGAILGFFSTELGINLEFINIVY